MIALAAESLTFSSGRPPENIGETEPRERSEPLALTQLILLYHLLQPDERNGH